jgi:8-oxo-dGTP pyrophosphatase MutT (NUDIX family)
VRPETGRAFWFPAGGGLEEGEGPRDAAVREVAEETGLAGLKLGPEVWHRRHVFEWRGVEWDQRETWFLAHVRHFEPNGVAMTETEKAEISGCRWWSLGELDASADDLVPRDLPARLRELLADGPPAVPIEIGT